MRSNANVRADQVWRSSDPRRLSAFRVVAVYADDQFVEVRSLYPIDPRRSRLRALRLESFTETGPKGYTRIS